ncbi:MAG TPA: hypothetical protein RMH99_23385 [Sandaracinaceae bacterium LLY-WYZ-13_1]|nr:hypothetical protein [Sandaracinaceae bacterium LLY-WYZ-13_1]
MRRAAALAALVGLATWVAPAPAVADWDAQLSTRLRLGGGAWIAEEGQDPWPLFELGLRGDLLLGEARPGTVRFGPAVDLRSEDFRTFELAGAAAVFVPTGRGFGLTVTGGAGWGARPEDRDGALAFGELAFGWRPYNYFSPYGYALNVYAGTRVQLEGAPRAWEVTVGVEVDLEFLVAIPFMFFVELARGEDPHEPEG